MNTIRSWMSHHPFKVVLFTFLFTIIPSIMAVTNEAVFWFGMASFTFFLIVLAFCWWKHGKKPVVPVLVMAAMLAGHAKAAEPEPEFKPAAGVGVGVVAVAVGGYCLYKLVRFCQKKFPPKNSGSGGGDTNSPAGLVAVGDEYGAAYEYSNVGSCQMTPGLVQLPSEFYNPTTFTINVRLENGSSSVSMSANNREGTAQTWDQFASEMAGHGLFLTGHASYEPQFSRNGIPCDGASVPIAFDPNTGRVIHDTGGIMRRVTVERSVDLIDWHPFLVTDTGEGTGLRVIDTTQESQMFYRVQVTQP